MSPDDVTARFNPAKAPAVLVAEKDDNPKARGAKKRVARERRRHRIADDPRRVVPHDDIIDGTAR